MFGDGPRVAIRYLLLDSCAQANCRLFERRTNAQAFQQFLDRAVSVEGHGTDRIVVLASDHPGDLVPYFDEAGNAVNGIWKDGVYVEARFIPADLQVVTPDVDRIHDIGAAAAGLTGAGATMLYLLWPHEGDDKPGEKPAEPKKRR